MSYEEDVNPFRTPAEPTVEDMIDILDEAMVDWLRKHGSSLYVCRDGARLTQDGLLKLASNMRRNLRLEHEAQPERAERMNEEDKAAGLIAFGALNSVMHGMGTLGTALSGYPDDSMREKYNEMVTLIAEMHGELYERHVKALDEVDEQDGQA